MQPTRKMTGTSTRRLTPSRLARISVAISPLRSATVAPSMMVSAIPNGANPV